MSQPKDFNRIASQEQHARDVHSFSSSSNLLVKLPEILVLNLLALNLRRLSHFLLGLDHCSWVDVSHKWREVEFLDVCHFELAHDIWVQRGSRVMSTSCQLLGEEQHLVCVTHHMVIFNVIHPIRQFVLAFVSFLDQLEFSNQKVQSAYF
jgi:hypothetical protein